MTHEIVDGFLPDEYLHNLCVNICSQNFPWYFGDFVGTPADINNCYFVHTVFNDKTVTSNFIDALNPLLNLIAPKELIKVRILQYMGHDRLIEHQPHTDYDVEHKACVLYLNTNNGFTRLSDGTCVESIYNRALTFNGNTLHNSTNCTDEKRRLVLTVNYH